MVIAAKHRDSLRNYGRISTTYKLTEVQLMTLWLCTNDLFPVLKEWEENESSSLTEDDDESTPKEKDKWEINIGKLFSKRDVEKDLRVFDVMTKEEVENVGNVWHLNLGDRWRLYRHWIVQYRQLVLDGLETYEALYNAKKSELAKIREQEDTELLSDSHVIGLTTSAAARLRPMLEKLKPPIVIVEEAAEVLEGHLISSISKHCKHLILIGDHQQLRPNPAVYELAKCYQLDVSLFERLVINGIDHQQLILQHRMRPCIAGLLVPHIYPRLINHEHVHNYEQVTGVKKTMFFVQHEHPEQDVEDSTSKINDHEARYLSRLCLYLTQQGYKQEQITVLATYSAQVTLLRCYVLAYRLKDVKVTTVDNYQGEENDIILLSLVRSNVERRVGFLGVSNRVCVALSRAKMGLFVIGNIEMLEKKSILWKNITEYLRLKGSLRRGLPVVCQNHSDTITLVESERDFGRVKDGGCNIKCLARLDNCNHPCRLRCHPEIQLHRCWCRTHQQQQEEQQQQPQANAPAVNNVSTASKSKRIQKTSNLKATQNEKVTRRSSVVFDSRKFVETRFSKR